MPFRDEEVKASYMEKISIIVPVYNVESYLEKCVSSLINQTYTNLEILLIDDGSTDTSGQLCDQLGKKDNRIRVIHTANFGVSHARNTGLDAMTGDFISFVDADDWIDADMYEKMLFAIIADDTDMCCGGYVKENGFTASSPLRKSDACTFTSEETLREMFQPRELNKRFWWEQCDKLYKRKLFEGIRYDEHMQIGEDMLVTWNLLQKNWRVSYLPLMGYHYRMRPESATHKQDNTIASLTACKMILDQIQTLPASSLKTSVLEWYASTLISVLRTRLNCIDSDTENNKFIQKELQWLRKHKWIVWKSGDMPFKKKLGMLFFCLPWFFCKAMRRITDI